MEFAAVQIIAVDTVQNSGSLIAGYLSKAGKSIKNNGSTGDLNRGRRTESRLLFGSFCRSKKNKTVPFRKLSDKQKVCPCRGSTLCVPLLPCRNFRGFANLKSAPLRGISLLFEKVGQNTGRRGAAPYLYTQSVYQYSPLRGISRWLNRHTGRLCYTYVTL